MGFEKKAKKDMRLPASECVSETNREYFSTSSVMLNLANTLANIALASFAFCIFIVFV